jgi:DNA-binding IscR family transcriptional regulator
MSYVAARAPLQLTTDTIAEAVRDHPARVRQLVAALVKADLLRSLRGAGGGIVLARPPESITLKDVYSAVDDQPLLSLGLRASFSGWDGICSVSPVLAGLYEEMEQNLVGRLAEVRLTALYRPAG